MSSDLLVTAIIRAPHGVRGEMKIFSTSGQSAHLRTLTQAELRMPAWSKSVDIEQIRGEIPNLILKLKGIDTPEEAAKLRGAEILVSRDFSNPLGQNEFYIGDLIDALVLVNKNEVARVLSVWQNGSVDMLEVRKSEDMQIIHLPFINEYFGAVSVEDKQLELLAPWLLE